MRYTYIKIFYWNNYIHTLALCLDLKGKNVYGYLYPILQQVFHENCIEYMFLMIY